MTDFLIALPIFLVVATYASTWYIEDSISKATTNEEVQRGIKLRMKVFEFASLFWMFFVTLICVLPLALFGGLIYGPVVVIALFFYRRAKKVQLFNRLSEFYYIEPENPFREASDSEIFGNNPVSYEPWRDTVSGVWFTVVMYADGSRQYIPFPKRRLSLPA